MVLYKCDDDDDDNSDDNNNTKDRADASTRYGSRCDGLPVENVSGYSGNCREK